MLFAKRIYLQFNPMMNLFTIESKIEIIFLKIWFKFHFLFVSISDVTNIVVGFRKGIVALTTDHGEKTAQKQWDFGVFSKNKS